MARHYENFDVEIQRAGEGYIARVRSPKGEGRAPFVLPLTSDELRILGLTVARGRKTTRAVLNREVDEVKAYGIRLFDALLRDDNLSCYLASVADVRTRRRAGLRVRMRLADAPELALVPWEYLFDRSSGRFLALEEETPIVRYLDLPLPTGALAIEPPLRVLVMISSPSDVPGLDTDEEWNRLNEALGDLVESGAVHLDRLDNATISQLRWKLKANDYHVFHFIGHGGVDAITERGILLFENEAGASDVVEAETVAGILSGEDTLRLAVLNACEGGRASKGNIFAGTAQCLVQQDVPAVIAMQFEISDKAAITLTHDFYKALSFGDPVDAALTEARRGLRYEQRNELEWGTPVLYMRANDGQLFDVKADARPQAPARETPAREAPVREKPGREKPPRPGAPRERPQPVASAGSSAPPPDPDRAARAHTRKIAELLHEAQLAAYAEKWKDAAAKLEEVIEIDPEHVKARAQLERVRHEEELDALYTKAVEHERDGRAGAAIEAFEKVRGLAGRNYRDADRHLEAMRSRPLRPAGPPPEAAPRPAPATPPTPKRPRKAVWMRLGPVVLGIGVLSIVAVIGSNVARENAYSSEYSGDPYVSSSDPYVSSDTAMAAPTPTYFAAADRDAEMAGMGLNVYSAPLTNYLAAGAEQVEQLYFDAAGSYRIAGSCDSDCGDLDLVLKNGEELVGEDVSADAVPVVYVTVTGPGYLPLTIRMHTCSTSTCGYRVQMYR